MKLATTGELKALIDNLNSWADNEEMVDQYYTNHGKDCKQAAFELERMLKQERVYTQL